VIREGALKGLGGPSGCGGVRGNLHFWSIFPPSVRSTVTHPRSLAHPSFLFLYAPFPPPSPPPSPLPPSLCCSLFPVRTKQRFHVLSSKLAYLLPDSTVARGTDWRHRVPKRLGAFVGSLNPRIVLGSRTSRLIPIRCSPSSRLALVRAERERARLAIHLRGGALSLLSLERRKIRANPLGVPITLRISRKRPERRAPTGMIPGKPPVCSRPLAEERWEPNLGTDR